MSAREGSGILNDNKHLNVLITACLIAGILISSGFTIFYLVTPEPPFHTFTILNGEKKMENYPTEASLGENISFYLGIGNYLDRKALFFVNISKGDNKTILSNSGVEHAEENITIGNINLNNDEQWISNKMNISFYDSGLKIIIAELWEVISSTKVFLNIIYIRVNITS